MDIRKRNTWRGLWPQPNSKHEFLNPKQIQMTKKQKFKTNRNYLIINRLRQFHLESVQKKQEDDG